MTKYLSFDGTSSRSEYWGVTIITFLIFIAAIVLGAAVMASGEIVGAIFGSVLMIAAAVLYVWAFLAVSIKRCREAAINPWWTASCFMPYIGWVPWIVIGCLSPAPKVENHG